ncbi:MAG: HEAT repeat domain-containing protein [Planctomycetota bacterium]
MFASAPEIHSPASLAVASPRVVFLGEDEYNSGGQGGRVKRCEDADGDGRADRFTVFAEGLNAPQGMTFADHTLFVVHAPLLTAYHDADGDGVAERVVNLVTGLGPKPKDLVHHIPSGIRLGIDGWLYISIGDKGIEHAVGSDGSVVRLEGGGVVRVRPDGSEIELCASGLRNTYDVAIDPLLNAFTRDNTNDGDGWNARLTHIELGAEYGYPRLFKNFADEIIPCLADYGGGSATGSFYVRELGWPAAFNEQLYTCDWGRGIVYRHVLTPSGATFTPSQDEFLQGGKPTDIEADGQGALIVADWARDGWGETAAKGCLYRITFPGRAVPPQPELAPLSDALLLDELASPSQVRVLAAQRELIARGERVAPALERLAHDQGSMPRRVAALFALAQILGAGSHPLLERLARDPSLREFAVRALCDRRTQLANVRADLPLAATTDADPRVRAQAAIALGRLGRASEAAALLPLTADRDVMVRHAALRSLRALHAALPCLAALDFAPPAVAQGALRTLRELHEPETVTGLIVALDRPRDRAVRDEIITTLARLYHEEGEWNGSWWDTRPDTRGPYYRPTTWAESARIGELLARELDRPQARQHTLEVLARYRIGAGTAKLAELALGSDALAADAARALVSIAAPEAAPAIAQIALSERLALELRSDAIGVLAHMATAAAASVLVQTVAALEQQGAPDDLARAAHRALEKIRSADAVPALVQLARASAAARASAYTALFSIDGAAARQAIEQAWQDDTQLQGLLAAVGPAQARRDLDRVRALLGDARPPIVAAALTALGDLRDADSSDAILPLVDRDATRSLALRALGSIGPSGSAAEVTHLAELMVSQAEALALGADVALYLDVAKSARAFSADARVDASRAHQLAARLAQLSGVLACYQVLGPIMDPGHRGMDVRLPPEQAAAGPFAPFAVDGHTYEWRPALSSQENGAIYLHDLLHTTEGAVALCTTTYEAIDAGPAELLIGSDDGVRVYLNGVQVHEHRGDRSLTPGEDHVAVHLERGNNVLLLKVVNTAGDFAVSVQVNVPRTRVASLSFESVMADALVRPGDVARGRELFEQVGCLKCHTVVPEDKPKGPFLGDAGERLTRAQLIESVLRPSAQIAQGFQPQWFHLQDGSDVNGFVVAESATEIEIRMANGTAQAIDKSQVHERGTGELSIMPEGLVDMLDREQLASLVSYVQSLRRRNPERPSPPR